MYAENPNSCTCTLNKNSDKNSWTKFQCSDHVTCCVWVFWRGGELTDSLREPRSPHHPASGAVPPSAPSSWWTLYCYCCYSYFNLGIPQWRIKGHVFQPLKGSRFTSLCGYSEQPLQYLMLCPLAVCFALCTLGCQQEPSRWPGGSLGTSSPHIMWS